MKKQLEKFVQSLLSRKFLAAVIVSTLTACNFILKWGLSTEELATIITPIITWLLLEGTADVVSRRKALPLTDFDLDEDLPVAGTGEVWTGAKSLKTFDEKDPEE